VYVSFLDAPRRPDIAVSYEQKDITLTFERCSITSRNKKEKQQAITLPLHPKQYHSGTPTKKGITLPLKTKWHTENKAPTDERY